MRVVVHQFALCTNMLAQTLSTLRMDGMWGRTASIVHACMLYACYTLTLLSWFGNHHSIRIRSYVLNYYLLFTPTYTQAWTLTYKSPRSVPLRSRCTQCTTRAPSLGNNSSTGKDTASFIPLLSLFPFPSFVFFSLPPFDFLLGVGTLVIVMSHSDESQ